jgi:ectoine hydroxylase-related dioxygenase (phytanoyl-CoA dioxygenase family)
MKDEDVLNLVPKTLDQSQREFYFENGYLLLEKFVPDEWLEKIRLATDLAINESRQISESDSIWDVEPGHTTDEPRLRRLTSPNDHNPVFWEYANANFILDLVEDLVGTDIKFHHSKLNFKWAHGGEEVKWHQDIQFWPHTNYSPMTVGTYLYDCDSSNGSLMVVPGSHKGKLYDQYGSDGRWSGHVSKEDRSSIDEEKAVDLPGPAGSITIHNCRTLHASKKNQTARGRPLLLNVYSSADAMPYTPVPTPSDYYQKILRGRPARWAHHDPRPCQIPPDWSGGYKSIFSYQQDEDQ